MTDTSVVSVREAWFAFPNLDRIIRGLLFVFVFSLPFKGLLFLERNGFLILLALLGVWCAVFRRHFFVRTPLDAPLAAYVGWVGLTIPFATYPDYSLKEFGKLLQQVLVFYTIVYFFHDRRQWGQLVRLLASVGVVVGAYGLVEFDDTVRGGGSFLRAEVWLTTYLVMLIPLYVALAWCEERAWAKTLYAAGALLLATCLLMARSRAGLLAFLAELWAFAWLLRRRTALALAGGVTVALVLTAALLVAPVIQPDGTVAVVPQTSIPVKTDTRSIVHRLDIWAFALERIAEHPVVGIGYGKETSKMLYGSVPEENLPPGHAPIRKHGTHNILLEQALLVGIPGLLLFVWLAVRVLRMAVDGYRRASDVLARAVLLGLAVGVTGLAVRTQFDQMFVGTLAIQFWVMAAVAVLAGGTSGASAGGEGNAHLHATIG